MAVVPPWCHPSRHDRQDRAAAHAAVAPARDYEPSRRMVDLGRATELAVAEPMTVQPELLAGGAARGPAIDASRWPGALR
jgi:hypothetical protein